MSDKTERTDAPDFSEWEAVIEAAVETAEKYSEEYRVVILESLLARAGARVPARPASTGAPAEPPAPVAGPDAEGDPIRRAALAADVDPDDLARSVIERDDGKLKILPTVDGSSKAEIANKAAAVYVFIREHGYGEMDVDIEDLRQVVTDMEAYDRANFTRNFRNYPWLLEIGQKGSPNKKYRLSGAGKNAARKILQEMFRKEKE